MKALIVEAEKKLKPGYVLSDFEKRKGWTKNANSTWKHPRLRLQEVDKAKITGKQVLIRVRACGVCGSDVHMAKEDEEDYMDYAGNTNLPVIMGHEFSGEIVEIGKEVAGLKVGDIVTCEEMLYCGECEYCKVGLVDYCNNLEEIGFTVPGAFAEYVAVSERYCWKINELLQVYQDKDKAFEAGALVEPTAVVCNAIITRAGGIEGGETVVVYGCGPIGLAAISVVRALGAAKVIAFEISSNRRKLAQEVGADYVFNPLELSKSELSAHGKVMEITEGFGANMHIEAAGANPRTIPEIMRSLAIKAKVVQIGMSPEHVLMDLRQFQFRAAKLSGSVGHTAPINYPRAIRLMASKKIDMTKIITKRFSLDQVIDAIRTSSSGNEGKVLVKP